MNEMYSYVLYGKKDIRLEKRRIPSPKSDEVLIKMKRVGICGSDIHYYEEGRVGNFFVKHPFIIGHEGAGEVVEIGNNVTNLQVGDRVTIDPSQPCYKCTYCKSGRYNLCRDMHYLGSASTDPHSDGLFSEYITMPANNCYPIPNNLSYDEAAMIEPLSVAIHSIKRAGIIYGASILITGGGTIGQLVLLAARAFGVGKIAMSEIVKERCDLARMQNVDIILDPNDQFIQQKIMDLTNGGFDIIIEASGSPVALKQAIEFIKPGGTIVLVGTISSEIPLPMNLVMSKELQIKGSFRFTNVFESAVNFVASGRINIKFLVTSTLPFNRLEEAIMLANSRHNNMKIQVEL